jgi:hypothetical protein
LPAVNYVGAAAGTLHARTIERDRVLAGADQDFARPIRHFAGRVVGSRGYM